MKQFRPLVTIWLLLVIVIWSGRQAAPLQAGSRTVDGDPSDWSGTASGKPHHDAESSGEWIYSGQAGDRRSDGGMSDEADLTEVRLTTDGTDLYFLFRLADISAANEVHIGVGLDTNQDNGGTTYNFLGDDSGLTYASRPVLRPEKVLSFHYGGGGYAVIESFAGSWTSPGGSIVIDATNDVVEASIPLASLGLSGSSDFIMTVATFQNNPVWNNDADSTDNFSTSDAVDVMGVPGQSGNAWSRDLDDGNVFYGWWIQLQGGSAAPTAVVWDSLYHSSCDQLLAADCGAGDHPAVENLPNDGNIPSGDPPTFLSAERWRSDGQPIPNRATDVFVFDDEAADVYIMALENDLSDGVNAPRIDYYAGSSLTVDMDFDYSWTGSWQSRPITTYHIYSGTIPSQVPGDVYYNPVAIDESGDRSLCRTSGGAGDNNKDRNLFFQWVGANGCSFNDYAYSVVDDDTSGPAISNVQFTDSGSNDQVCATVSDDVSDSGDNDSGLQQVILRYDASQGNVSSGGGSTAVMSGGPLVWCVSGLNFTDPTYYRVEATNNDFDNGSSADRESSLTTILCEGGSCAAPSGDNDVRWLEVLHDTRNRTAIPTGDLYRDPFGAVPTNATVTMTIRTADSDLTGATLRVYGSSTNDYAMSKLPGELDPTYDWWQASFSAPTTAGTIYYKFFLTDGTDTDWYIDDYAHNSYDHEDRFENGTGMMVDNGEDPAFFANAFNIAVYDAAGYNDLDGWAQDAVIYQIMPDRFRNGDSSNDTSWPYGDVYGNAVLLHSTWNEAPEDGRLTGKWSRDFFGGDLQGVIDELDYLQSIGVTAIYFNPIFASPSNHGYDTTDYLQISPRYGDNALFATLNGEAEARGIKLILDGVFNHTGSDSVYFDRYDRWDASGNAAGGSASGACETAASPFAPFYNLYDVDDASGPCYDGKSYDSWWGYDTLPNLIDYVGGNAVRDFIFDADNDGDNGITAQGGVIQYWYAQGADGWRFDVADEIPHDFWSDFRSQVKGNDGLDGPLYSEVWFEANPWLYGDQLDATMNYRYRKAVLGFLVDSDWVDNDNNGEQTVWQLSPSQLDYVLGSIREDYPAPAWYAMMNLMGSHDTNRALFVLDSQSASLSDALAKMEMMAALQFTYPGAPTVFYGDEVGLGALYGSGGEWGAGRTVNGIIQDDPYNRHPYPWSDESGSLPGGLPNASLQNVYRLLGLARGNYDVLRSGEVTTLLTDDGNNVYAYARSDGSAPACAIAIFNRSGISQNVTVDVSSLPACSGTFEDVLNGGADWTVAGGSLTVNGIPALSSAVLLPAFDNPNTADGVASLPSTSVSLSAASGSIAAGGSTSVSATILDLAGQAVPAGMTVDFTILSGRGLLGSATALTNGSGVATVAFNDSASSGRDTALIQASITAPSGIVYRATTTVFMGYGVAISGRVSRPTGIGPETVSSGGVVTATKSGNGEPVVSLALFAVNPVLGSEPIQTDFVDVHVYGAGSDDELEIRVACSASCSGGEGLWWWDGSSWQEFSLTGQSGGSSGYVWGRVIGESTSPKMSQLTGTPIGGGSSSPTAITLGGAQARPAAALLWPLLAAAVGLLFLSGYVLRRVRGR